MQSQKQSIWADNDFLEKLAPGLKIALFVLLGFVCIQNIPPYIQVVEQLDQTTGATDYWSSIFLIGFIFSLVSRILLTIVGVGLWALIQVGEFFHLLIKPYINKLPEFLLRNAWAISLGAYLFDGWLAWSKYPPIDSDLFLFLAAPSFEDINKDYLMAFLVMMLAVEALVYPILIVLQVIKKLGIGVKRNGNP